MCVETIPGGLYGYDPFFSCAARACDGFALCLACSETSPAAAAAAAQCGSRRSGAARTRRAPWAAPAITRLRHLEHEHTLDLVDRAAEVAWANDSASPPPGQRAASRPPPASAPPESVPPASAPPASAPPQPQLSQHLTELAHPSAWGVGGVRPPALGANTPDAEQHGTQTCKIDTPGQGLVFLE